MRRRRGVHRYPTSVLGSGHALSRPSCSRCVEHLYNVLFVRHREPAPPSNTAAQWTPLSERRVVRRLEPSMRGPRSMGDRPLRPPPLNCPPRHLPWGEQRMEWANESRTHHLLSHYSTQVHTPHHTSHFDCTRSTVLSSHLSSSRRHPSGILLLLSPSLLLSCLLLSSPH